MVLLEQWLDDQSFVNWARQNNKVAIAKWEEYINHHSEHWELVKIGRRIVIGIPFKEISIDETKGKISLAALMRKLETKAQPVKMEVAKRKYRNNFFMMPKLRLVAASIAVIMFISGISYFQFFHNAEVLVTTGYGEQIETQLPDGSKVILNANSILKYYCQNPRIVWLQGEAFFEIEKKTDIDENFQVVTQDLKVTVLGTSFNVNARNDQTKVFLEEGKIDLEVNNDESEVIKMNPGDLITYSKKQKRLKEKKKNVSVLENASWKDGALIFNKSPLVDALYDIEDIYGIRFVLESEELKDETISGGVPIKDLKVMLETLHEIYGIQIRTEGQRYFLSKRQ